MINVDSIRKDYLRLYNATIPWDDRKISNFALDTFNLTPTFSNDGDDQYVQTHMGKLLTAIKKQLEKEAPSPAPVGPDVFASVREYYKMMFSEPLTTTDASIEYVITNSEKLSADWSACADDTARKLCVMKHMPELLDLLRASTTLPDTYTAPEWLTNLPQAYRTVYDEHMVLRHTAAKEIEAFVAERGGLEVAYPAVLRLLRDSITSDSRLAYRATRMQADDGWSSYDSVPVPPWVKGAKTRAAELL